MVVIAFFSARWSVQILRSMANVEANLPKITWPFLLMHGSEDKICHPRGSQLLQEKAGSSDKTFKVCT